jgi:hypothetical protein
LDRFAEEAPRVQIALNIADVSAPDSSRCDM